MKPFPMEKLRAMRKQARLSLCSLQAKEHKAKQIIREKGSNGRSMNANLLALHGLGKGDQQ